METEVAIIKHKRGDGSKKTHTIKKLPSLELAQKFVGEFNRKDHDEWCQYATIVVNW